MSFIKYFVQFVLFSMLNMIKIMFLEYWLLQLLRIIRVWLQIHGTLFSYPFERDRTIFFLSNDPS